MQRPKLTEILLRKIFLEGAVSEPRRNTLGTENFVRIMVESSDKKLIKDTLGEVKKLILNYA